MIVDNNRGKIKESVVDPISGERTGRCSACYNSYSIFKLHYVKDRYRCKNVKFCKISRQNLLALSIQSW